MATRIEQNLADMQRLILQSYPRRPAARYMLFRVTDSDAARSDLEKLLPHVASADAADRRRDEKSSECRINIAFTNQGLEAMGLDSVRNVPLAFREGMNGVFRAHRLGDDPTKWDWGTGPENGHEDIHVLIALFSALDGAASCKDRIIGEDDHDVVRRTIRALLDRDWHLIGGTFLKGLQPLEHRLPDAYNRSDQKGHFGYRDGISNPYIEGSGTAGTPVGKHAFTHIVKPGEFILGYPNEFSETLPPLLIDSELDRSGQNGRGHLAADSMGLRDFGRNGSYLVFRQLHQDVTEFEKFLTKQATLSAESPAIRRKIYRGRRAIQRIADDLGIASSLDDQDVVAFCNDARKRLELELAQVTDEVERAKRKRELALYADLEQAFVALCKYERHLREYVAAKLMGRWRSGAPLVKAYDEDNENLKADNDFLYAQQDRYGYRCPIGAHIRRGYPRDTAATAGGPATDDLNLTRNRRRRLIRRGRPYYGEGTDLGLYFICLNANIRDQFEFVQETWINNTEFGNSRGEIDPIVGLRNDGVRDAEPFTVQRSPVSVKYSHGPFVTVKGGAYFFLPSISALRFICDLSNR